MASGNYSASSTAGYMTTFSAFLVFVGTIVALVIYGVMDTYKYSLEQIFIVCMAWFYLFTLATKAWLINPARKFRVGSLAKFRIYALVTGIVAMFAIAGGYIFKPADDMDPKLYLSITGVYLLLAILFNMFLS